MVYRPLLALLLLGSSASCMAVGWAPTAEEHEKFALEKKLALEKRAKFDLSCQTLSLVPLETSPNGHYTKSYGVVGCGRKVTYVIVDGVWVMNVSEGQPTGDTPQVAPAPPLQR